MVIYKSCNEYKFLICHFSIRFIYMLLRSRRWPFVQCVKPSTANHVYGGFQAFYLFFKQEKSENKQ